MSPQRRAHRGLRYLKGRLHEELDQPGAALDAWEFDSLLLPAAVAQDLLLRRAALLQQAGRCAEVGPLLEPLVLQRGEQGEGARDLAARCLSGPAEALSRLADLRRWAKLSGGGAASWEIHLRQAEALGEAGRQAQAQAMVRQQLLARPDHPEAARAQDLYASLGGELHFSVEERLARARLLFKRRRYSAVLAELDNLEELRDRRHKAEGLHLRGMALYRSRQYDEAAPVLRRAARLDGPTAVDDAFHAARALARADQDDAAIVAFRALVADEPRHRRAAEAEYLAAWLELRHGRRRGQQRMRRFLNGRRAKAAPQQRRDALWQLGIRAFERRQYSRAEEYFGRYADAGQEALVWARGRYWQGRSLEARGRRQRALDRYREVMAREPLHWYGLLSLRRVRALGQTVSRPWPDARTQPAPTPLPPAELPEEAAFYASLGLADDASQVVAAQERRLRSLAPRGRGAELLVQLYRSLGDTRRAYRLAAVHHRSLHRPPRQDNRWVWDAAYPRPYTTVVEVVAGEHNVEPAYVFATMRQESGYAEKVKSRAGAVGLLQLLPRTAAKLAQGMGVSFEESQLLEPEWNIRYGITEMKHVIEVFDGCLPLAIASYNAGLPRVRRWLGETGETDLDFFVEWIPFRETRNYVRRVMSHYQHYLYLEQGGRDWPEIELPERVGAP
jgi:soluble lytic murein transglycosylase